LGMSGDTSPALADLDLDGRLDLIVPSIDGPALFRLSQSGEVLWRVPLPRPATAGVTLGDIDRDGALDILIACGDTLFCFNPEGRERWHRTFLNTIRAHPTIADLEGDGRSEVIVGCNDNRLHVLDARGRDKWSFAAKSWFTGGAAVADLDGDGRLEIVAGSLDNSIYCLDAKGKVLWRYQTGDWVQGDVVIADVDGDLSADVVTTSDDGELYCLSARGTLKWHESFGQQRLKAHLAVADLDNDGTAEILLTAPDGNASLFSAFGDRIWRTSVGSQGPSSDTSVAAIGTPLLVDVNGDKLPEIVWAARDGYLHVLDVWGRQTAIYRVGGSIEASPMLADADRDGKWEVYVGNVASRDGKSGFFSAYEFSSNGGQAAWASLGGDPYRTLRARNAGDYGANLSRGGDYATSWEPFGIGYRPARGVLAPRRLRVTALPLQDLDGNRDGALDPGETALWRIQVENLGRGASYDSLLTVDLGDSFLHLDRTRAYLGWIAPGARKIATFRIGAPPISELLQWQQQQQIEARTPFRDVQPASGIERAAQREVTVVAASRERKRFKNAPSTARQSLPSSRTLNRGGALAPMALPLPPVMTKVRHRQPLGPQTARLQVLESGVQAGVSRVRVWNMPPLPPVLSIARQQIIDGNSRLTAGNGNGRLDAGESVVLRLWLRNTNLTTARRAVATLRPSSSDVLVATSIVEMKDVTPGGGRQIDFALRVARQPLGRRVRLTLDTRPTTQGAPVPSNRETLDLPLGGAALDLEPPRITLQSPVARIASTTKDRIVIAGMIADASGVADFLFNGKALSRNQWRAQGSTLRRFWLVRPLKVGENVFILNATDRGGNSVALPLRVVRLPAASATATPARSALGKIGTKQRRRHR